MRRLLQSTRSYALLKAEKGRKQAQSRLSAHFRRRAQPQETALKEFAKIFFNEEGNPFASERIFELIDAETFSDCLFFPAEGKKFSVEDAEKITEESALKPVEGKQEAVLSSAIFAEATVQAQKQAFEASRGAARGRMLSPRRHGDVSSSAHGALARGKAGNPRLFRKGSEGLSRKNVFRFRIRRGLFMRRLRAAAWARPKTFWREGIIRLLPPTPSSWRRQILSACPPWSKG